MICNRLSLLLLVLNVKLTYYKLSFPGLLTKIFKLMLILVALSEKSPEAQNIFINGTTGAAALTGSNWIIIIIFFFAAAAAKAT